MAGPPSPQTLVFSMASVPLPPRRTLGHGEYLRTAGMLLHTCTALRTLLPQTSWMVTGSICGQNHRLQIRVTRTRTSGPAVPQPPWEPCVDLRIVHSLPGLTMSPSPHCFTLKKNHLRKKMSRYYFKTFNQLIFCPHGSCGTGTPRLLRHRVDSPADKDDCGR